MGRIAGDDLPTTTERVGSTLRFTTPTAAAAFVLQDLLHKYGATARPVTGEAWEVEVPLLYSPRETVPSALAVARQWLALCDLRSTEVSLDGHIRILQNGETLVTH